MKRNQQKRKVWRLSFLVTSMLICLAFLPGDTIGAVTKTQGDYVYYINDNDEVTILEYSGTSKIAEVPSEIEGKKVVSIDEQAFYDSDKLEKVLLPDSLTKIDQSAFDFCISLKEVNIPNGVKNLPYFDRCRSIEVINISEDHPDFASVDGSIFNKKKTILYRYLADKKKTSYTIPSSVKIIDGYAFVNAYSKYLTTITLSKSVTSIEDSDGNEATTTSTFVGCENLKKFIVDKNNKTFTTKDGVLYSKQGTSLRGLVFYPPKKQGSSFKVPEGVVGMGTHAFYRCYNLKKIYIPKSMKSIGCYFKYCKNLSIMLPDTVQHFGVDGHLEDFPILDNCTNCYFYVKEYSVAQKFFQSASAKRAGLKYKVEKVKTYLYGKCRYIVKNNQITIIKYSGTSKTLSIPSKIKGKKVVAIGIGAFSDNKYLTKITIPTNVITIGDKSFSGCKKLSTVSLPKTLKYIGDSAFYYCKSLKKLTLPVNVTKIGASAFRLCGSLEGINIPEKVTSIRSRCFEGCDKLKTVKLSSGITKIESEAFYACPSIKSITLPKKLKSLGWGCFSNCSNLKKIKLPNGIISIETSAFFHCTSLETVLLPESLKELENNLFYGCTSLKKIRIPGSIVKVNEGILTGCSNIEEVELASGITTIESGAFQYLEKLKTVRLPDTLKTLEKYCFYKCPGLETITFPNGVTEISDDAFIDCNKECKFYVTADSLALEFAKKKGLNYIIQ